MATYYVGSRPVLQGRSSKNMINPTTGVVGKYTYSGNWGSEQVLDGAPDTAIPLRGTSDYRSGGILQWLFSNGPHVSPMANAGLGPHVGFGRLEMLQYRGVPSGKVFESTFGQYNDVEWWTWTFDGLPGNDPLAAPGRVGVVKLNPHIRRGVGEAAMLNPGHTIATKFGAINRWTGVPSSKAL